ncbi:hypothetical protein [Pseudocolwellia agarivorans]|uniref:hypothetical protein n=1 Tax=Pseudocolwellia agarivorans TaxID=1911682 RepID=UPI000986DAAB|nr:hypothetical protein [Pseudocolwellia agarivorans]
MFNYHYPNIGRLDRLCKGHYVLCQFGYPHLVCKPEDKPADPLLAPPLAQFVSCASYGEQFLQNLHQWKNVPNIVNKLFCYYVNDDYQQANQHTDKIINLLATALEQGSLVIIPLDHED